MAAKDYGKRSHGAPPSVLVHSDGEEGAELCTGTAVLPVAY